MADNVTLPGSGAVVAADEAGGAQYQKVKLVDGTADSTTVIPGDADGLKVKLGLAIPAGSNNIGDVDVLSLPSIPAGSNNIGDVDVLSIAAGDNNIGNVDVLTVPADPFGANADAASPSGSISAKLRTCALDLEELSVNGIILKAGSATIGKIGANTGVDIGDVTINNAAGASAVNIQDGGNTITVDGTVTTSPSGDHTVIGKAADGAAVSGNPVLVAGQDGTNVQTLKTDVNGELQIDILTIAAGDTNIGNVDIVTVPADPFGANADAASASGSISAKLREIATNGVILKAGTAGIGKLTANDGVDIGNVDVASIATGSNVIGKVGIDQTTDGTTNKVAATQATASNLNAQVVGSVAHAGTDGGNPVKIGFKAETTYQTAVTDGQRTDGVADVYGCQFVRPDHPRAWSYHLDTSTAQTDASVQSAPGSGLSVYITDIVFSSGAATAINMFIEEGSTKILGPYYLEAVAGRGFAISFKTPKKCTANTAITLTTSQSIAHTVDITGFIAP